MNSAKLYVRSLGVRPNDVKGQTQRLFLGHKNTNTMEKGDTCKLKKTFTDHLFEGNLFAIFKESLYISGWQKCHKLV